MKTEISLTSLQISHTIVALKEYADGLLRSAESDPQGGEHEDYLIAQSVIKELAEAKGRIES